MSYTTELENNILKCSLCPHGCKIKPDKAGICGIRFNKNGKLYLPFYGKLSAVALDPIEKKPLYHFHPGEKILSVGFFGCNLHCPFCQNYSISQRTDSNVETVDPEIIIHTAEHNKSFGVAYTYSEPSVHFEYVLECSKHAKKHGIKNVLVTNGFLNQEPLKELLEYTDAANIDLKCFNEDFYKHELCGNLQSVLDFIKTSAGKTHIEITTLIIPDKNDSLQEVTEICKFIASIDKNIPFHISAYYPAYKYKTESTTPEKILELVKLSRQYLNYVYHGNIAGECNTHCPSCRNILISRQGYHTEIKMKADSICPNCGFKINIIQNTYSD